MGKTENFVVGLFIGTTVGAAIAYIFGPAQRTTFDANYQSRWQRALSEGKKAEVEYKAALEQQFAEAKQGNTLGQD